VRVLVHPECPFDVVQAADFVGSTEFIIDQVARGEAGTSWAIGTEIHLVHRLAGEHPDQKIRSLAEERLPVRDDEPHRSAHLRGLWRTSPRGTS